MKKIILIAVALVLVALIIIRLASVHENNTSQDTDILLINDVCVNVSKVIVSEEAFAISSTGTLYPIKSLDISAETQGKITSVNFNLGQNISAGATIACIDNSLRKISSESAEVEFEKQKKDYERTIVLFKGGTATEQEVETAKLSFETAKYRLDEAEKQLSYTSIKSSISGQISQKNVELGTYVNPGTVIASVVDISKFKAKMYLSESNVYNIKLGDQAKLNSELFPNKTFEGKITFISPVVDESHNYLVEVEVENDKKNPMRAGTFVNIEINIPSHKASLYIPRAALQGSIKDAKVFVAQGNKAVLKPIVIGRSNNDLLEVISGISESDIIIVSGLINLTDGKSIKIINN